MTRIFSVCFECNDNDEHDDAAVLMVFADNGKKTRVVNCLVGTEAIDTYKVLVGNQDGEE